MSEGSYEQIAKELLKVAEGLNGERWYAMTPPWSGQFVLSGAEDPYAGRFVCCTDPTLHMDEEDLRDYEGDNPGERVDFIVRCDPATVKTLARAVLDQQKTIERLNARIKEFDDRLNESGDWYGQMEIERLKSELRIEKASQATRGNW